LASSNTGSKIGSNRLSPVDILFQFTVQPVQLLFQLRGESVQTLPIHISAAPVGLTISQAISKFFR
jgi:hypothetical protein